jgi:hypothetical protein
MVKTIRHCVTELGQGGDSGVAGAESVLVVSSREEGVESREEEGFEGFDDGTEKGDWAVARGGLGVFARFGDGDDDGGLPNGGDSASGEGEVK